MWCGIVHCAYTVTVPSILKYLKGPIDPRLVHVVQAEHLQVIHRVQESNLLQTVEQLVVQFGHCRVYVSPHPLNSLIVVRAPSDNATSVETPLTKHMASNLIVLEPTVCAYT